MDFIVHIGFPKTGTSTLQDYLFSKHPEIKYLGKPYGAEDFKQEIHRLLTEETITYNPSSPIKYFQQHLFSEIAPKHKVVLLSDEILVSYSKVRDKGVVADRIKKVLQPTKILITIRNQFSTLKSAYFGRGRILMNVPDRFSGLHVSFEEWLKLSFDNINRSFIGHVDYFKTINYYSKIFSEDNLHILLFEEFITEKEKFIKKLSRILDIDFKESLDLVADHHARNRINQASLDFECFKSRFYPFTRLPYLPKLLKPYYYIKKIVKGDKKANIDFRDPWVERLSDIYKQGNRELIKRFDLPLEKYGYPV